GGGAARADGGRRAAGRGGDRGRAGGGRVRSARRQRRPGSGGPRRQRRRLRSAADRPQDAAAGRQGADRPAARRAPGPARGGDDRLPAAGRRRLAPGRARPAAPPDQADRNHALDRRPPGRRRSGL
ncbi:MAG: hypothetical protein AVDCRST_MAG04-130, partial [uncultured Acetobacteraceae bacterium]